MIAHGFVANGAKVYISSRSAKVCDKVAEDLTKLGPGQCISIPADLQSLDEVKRLTAVIAKKESSEFKTQKSTVIQGLENAGQAFADYIAGKYHGKVIVQVV